MTAPLLDFDGETYDREIDGVRLSTQLIKVRATLLRCAGRYLTPDQLCRGSGYSPARWASVSARVRDLRKDKFGGLNIKRKRLAGGEWAYGLFEEGE